MICSVIIIKTNEKHWMINLDVYTKQLITLSAASRHMYYGERKKFREFQNKCIKS
jgi:hypothetical protein